MHSIRCERATTDKKLCRCSCGGKLHGIKRDEEVEGDE